MKKILLLLICFSEAALPDHGVHDTGLAPAQTNSLIQLQQSRGRFEVEGVWRLEPQLRTG